jgi:hypothetical protein
MSEMTNISPQLRKWVLALYKTLYPKNEYRKKAAEALNRIKRVFPGSELRFWPNLENSDKEK